MAYTFFTILVYLVYKKSQAIRKHMQNQIVYTSNFRECPLDKMSCGGCLCSRD